MKNLIPNFLDHIENHKQTIEHNHKLFNVYEGELMPLVAESLRSHLSTQVYEQSLARISPINVLIKIVDKL